MEYRNDRFKELSSASLPPGRRPHRPKAAIGMLEQWNDGIMGLQDTVSMPAYVAMAGRHYFMSTRK